MALVLIAVLLTGGRASAHAELVAADPPAAAVLAEAPAAVALRFSEQVRPLAARWFLPDGASAEAAPQADGETVTVPLPPRAGAGTLLLSWRVVSIDGHPVGGSHAFSIGTPTQPAAAPPAGRPWGAAAGRGLLTLLLVVGVGGTVSLRLVHSGPDPTPRARHLALWSACATPPAALLAAGLHGLDLFGAPAATLLGPSPWSAARASPFDPSVCTPDLVPEFNALIRTRWAPQWKREGRRSEPSLRTLNWDTLSEAERADVCAMADRLAQYHQQFVRRGRPRKGDLDAAMIDLADIFLSYTRSPIPRHEVPYADESLFIQFAVLALEPAAAYFEVSGSALSGRWERLVVEDRKVSKASQECDTP